MSPQDIEDKDRTVVEWLNIVKQQEFFKQKSRQG